jgi:hypothetical protein
MHYYGDSQCRNIEVFIHLIKPNCCLNTNSGRSWSIEANNRKCLSADDMEAFGSGVSEGQFRRDNDATLWNEPLAQDDTQDREMEIAATHTETYDFLPSSKPATKIVKHPESMLAEAHCPGDTTVSDLPRFWDDTGELIYTEPIDHSSELHPLVAASSDVAFSDTSPDDSSSGALFESGSEMTEESAGLETKEPFTTPVLMSGDQENELARSMAEFGLGLENALEVWRTR